MRDSRLVQAQAAIDDARCLIADIREELSTGHENTVLAVAQTRLNSALMDLQGITERDDVA